MQLKFKLLISLLLISSCAFSQVITQKLHYKKSDKNKDIFRLIGEDSVEMTKAVSKGSRIFKRSVYANKANYILEVHRKENKIYLNNSSLQTVATMPLKGKSRLTITLTDGTKYTWKKSGGRSWKYVTESGEEIISTSFIKEGSKKYIKHEIKNPNVPGFQYVLTVSDIYGVDLIQSKAQAPIWISLSVLAGILLSM